MKEVKIANARNAWIESTHFIPALQFFVSYKCTDFSCILHAEFLPLNLAQGHHNFPTG